MTTPQQRRPQQHALGGAAYPRAVRLLALVIVVGCNSSDSVPSAQHAPPTAQVKPSDAPPKPPDDMDERMRHCPLSLDGASATLEDIDGGVRFTIEVPDHAIDEVRRRAHHIVDFAAKRTRAGHGEFDGKGGGRMKNCPVITDGVNINATDIARGARLDIIAASGQVARLRADTRARVAKFPFVGATIKVSP